MNKIIEISLDYNKDLESALKGKVRSPFFFRIINKNLDARRAPNGRQPQCNYTVEVVRDPKEFTKVVYNFPKISTGKKPVIIGAGPAGLFAAVRLLEYGIPSIIYERGAPALERMKSIAKFWRYGEFDPESNACFGEGGAGLYSDGKLISRIKSPFP